MLAVGLDNLLFLLLIAGAALFQLLSKAVTKANKNQSDKTSTPPVPPRPPQVQRAPPESDADRIRKFLEALGQPPSSTPPAPIAPRTDIPPRPLAPVQPPVGRAWERTRSELRKPVVIPREISPPEQPRHMEFVKPTVPAPVALAFDVHKTLPIGLQQTPIVGADTAASRQIAKEPGLKTDIVTLLASKSGLRDAIVIREILGPPLGLRTFDLL